MSQHARPVREIEVSIPGLTLAAREWEPNPSLDGPSGSGADRTVLALHGWLDNAASFDTLVPLLPPSLRVIALDLAGHGLSQHRHPSAGLFFLDWVREVFAVARALELQRFSLLGHSMGAAVACLAAGTLPARIERLVLIEGLGPLAAPAEQAPQLLERHLTEHKPGRAGRPYPSLDAAAAVRAKQPNAPLTLDSARSLVARGMRDVNGEHVWRHDAGLRTTSVARLTEEQVQAFLRRITAPTLLISADDGWPYPKALLEARAACVADLRVVSKPGAHHLHLDTPEIVAEEIGAFLLGQTRSA